MPLWELPFQGVPCWILIGFKWGKGESRRAGGSGHVSLQSFSPQYLRHNARQQAIWCASQWRLSTSECPMQGPRSICSSRRIFRKENTWQSPQQLTYMECTSFFPKVTSFYLDKRSQDILPNVGGGYTETTYRLHTEFLLICLEVCAQRTMATKQCSPSHFTAV